MSCKIDEEQLINILSEVNEIYAKTEIIQKYKNKQEHPIEIRLQFPILNDYKLSKFIISKDKKVIISRILEKEKGKEKYNDEISSGNTAVLGEIFESGEKLEIIIGNLLPNETLEIKTQYFQIINSEDMSYCYNLIQIYPKIILKNDGRSEIGFKGIKCNIYISTRSQLTRFIILNKIKDIKYCTEFSNSLTYVKIFFEKYNYNIKPFKLLPYSCLKIIFRTENINTPTLYCQYDTNKKESSYLLHYIYSISEIPTKFSEYINSNNQEKLQFFDPENYIDTDQKICYSHKYAKKSEISYPSCYIFLIDQSGSMYNDPIKILKETLIMFLKSLPFGSYFQIIGFGTSLKKYNNAPIEYNKDNLEQVINVISGIEANLGQTHLYKPLEDIYKQNYSNEVYDLSLNIIIITDGKVSNVKKCINLVSQNAERYRVHAIGIGRNYDKYLIEQLAKAGRGEKFFISNINNLIYKTFDILNNCSNEYLKNIKFEFKNNLEYFNKSQYNILPYSSNINQNDVILYGFICPSEIISPNNLIQMNVVYNNNQNKNIEIKSVEQLNNGDELSKLIIGTLINSKILNKNLSIKEIVQLSKDYNVLSEHTCFFGSIENYENNQDYELIQLNNYYLPDNTKSNVQIVPVKTGKHGHGKKYERILNESEVKLSELIEDNSEREININTENKEFEIIKEVIKKQNIDGSWDKRIFDEEKYDDLFKKLNDYFLGQNINTVVLKNVCYTFSIIYVLKQYFCLYETILYQIINKGKYYLKKNGIDYNDINKNINMQL